MAARFAKGTGVWSSTGTWSTTSGGATGASVPTSADDVTLDSNTTALTIDVTATCKTFTEASGFVGSVTHNAFVLTVAGNVTFIAGSTYTPLATSTLTISATATLTTGGLLMPLIAVSAGTTTLGDNLNFMASKVMTLTLTGALNLNGKTISGNSSVNRVLIQSNTVGTGRTVTIASGTFANADFMDCTFSSASNLDLSAITGKSGDCGGNTLTGGGSTLTFTTAVPQTCTMSTNQNASTLGIWTSRVPLPQDNVSYSGVTGGILTQDMPRIGANVDWTGASSSPGWTISTPVTLFGNINLTNLTGSFTGNLAFTLAGRSNQTVTSAGKAFPFTLILQAPGGTYTQQDALTVTNSGLSVQFGTWTTNSFSVTVTSLQTLNVNGVNTRVLNCGTSIITCTFTGTSAAALFGGTGSNLTINAAQATIIFSTPALTSGTLSFFGSGATYGTLRYNGALGVGPLNIVGANTFTTLTIGSGRGLTLPSATTTTIASGGSFAVNGSPNNFLYLPGVAANYASAPNAAPLQITGDITLDWYGALNVWSGVGFQSLIARNVPSSNRSYNLTMDNAGKVEMITSADGSTFLTSTSTVVLGLSAGAPTWVRASLQVNDGSGHNVVKFYTSSDGVSWAQLGSTVTNAGTTSINAGTAALEIGSNAGGVSSLGPGIYYRARIYNSYLQASAGTPVFDANFATKTVGANSFTESSANAATVTINGTLAQVGDGRVAITASTPGSAATLSGTAAQLQNCDYLTIQDSTASPANAFYAGHHSTSVSNVSGWVFGVGYTGLIASSIAHSVAVSRVLGASRTLSSSITHTTAISRVYGAVRPLSSTIAHGMTLTRAGTFGRALSSSISHTVTTSRLVGASRLLSSSIAHTSSITRAAGLMRTVSNSVAHSSTMTRQATFTRALSSSIAHSATLTRILIQVRTIASAIGHTMTLTRQAAYTRQIGSSIAHTMTLLYTRVRPAAIRAAYAAALRLATHAPVARLATFAAALRLRIVAATGTYQQTGGQQMLSTPVGTGAAYIGPLEARRPFVLDLRDRLAPGETVTSVTVTAQVTLPGTLTKVAAPGFVVSWSLCGSVSSIVVDTGGTGADSTTQAHLTDPTYPGYPATLQTVVGGGAVTAVTVTNDGGLAYVGAPTVSFTGAGSGIAAHALAPASGVVYLLGNGAQVAGATYYVSIAWTTSSDPAGVEQVTVPGLPCQAG